MLSQVGRDYKSDFVAVYPEGRISSGKFEIRIKTKELGGLETMEIYRSTSDDLEDWEKVDSDVDGDRWATIQTQEGGVYVARSSLNAGAIAGIVIGGLAFIAIVVIGVVMYMRANPETKSKFFRPLQKKV